MIQGIVPVLYSFYGTSGALDLDAHLQQLAWVMTQRASGVTLLGLASEGASLAQDERKSVIAHRTTSSRIRDPARHDAPRR